MEELARKSSALISVMIPSRNEALHIERAVKSARRLTPHVFVVDSTSTDGTPELARSAGAEVIAAGDFPRFAEKLNWCADNIAFPTPWVLRLDCDEILTAPLVEHLPERLSRIAPTVSGVYLRRQIWFMGRWIRHGGMYPTYSMRLWRRGDCVCEARDLDEHMILRTGEATHLPFDIIDNPLFDLSTWTDKHNSYASREARASLRPPKDSNEAFRASLLGTAPERVRWLKTKVFYRLPLFLRPSLYFLYRYLLRLGFLDGMVGFAFHFLHGFWYRVLVDAKILEARLRSLEPSPTKERPVPPPP